MKYAFQIPFPILVNYVFIINCSAFCTFLTFSTRPLSANSSALSQPYTVTRCVLHNCPVTYISTQHLFDFPLKNCQVQQAGNEQTFVLGKQLANCPHIICQFLFVILIVFAVFFLTIMTTQDCSLLSDKIEQEIYQNVRQFSYNNVENNDLMTISKNVIGFIDFNILMIFSIFIFIKYICWMSKIVLSFNSVLFSLTIHKISELSDFGPEPPLNQI